ncbi:MAG: aldo/keto reductase [Halanaerobiaceae bacterium]
MQYRKFGDLDFEVSALGFGAMRLPTDDDGNIDEPEAIKMIRYAIDNGVNYIDTAWPYHGGESEKVVAKALKDGYREKVKLATKLPSWEIEEPSDLDYYLNKQLEKLEVDKIDFYLLHALNEGHWGNYKEIGLENVFAWVDKIKEQGKIDYIGFSFHDDYDLFEEIIDVYEDGWDFCQIQYNYLDTELQAGRRGLKYAANKNIPVVVMEPLRGGQLAQNPPEEVKEIMEEFEDERTPADWALQWLWNQPEVTTVLSGMSTMEQVEENVESAANSGVGILSEKELNIIDKMAEKFRGPIQCTKCNYCMPCPNGVEIPRNFELYNKAKLYDKFEENKEDYMDLDEGKRASACVNCGVCEEACPQNLEIITLLEEVTTYFEK